MWLLFGFIAVILTLINLFLYATGKDYKLAMALALAFTALTLCAEHHLIASWVKAADWAALEDVVPTMEKVLWTLTLASIVLNMLPIFLEKKQSSA